MKRLCGALYARLLLNSGDVSPNSRSTDKTIQGGLTSVPKRDQIRLSEILSAAWRSFGR